MLVVLGENGDKWNDVFCTGTFERVLDDKQRLLLPKTVKKSLSDSESIYLTPGQDGCLELHGYDSLQLRSSEFTNSRSGNMKKAFSRLFYYQAERCQFDSQNRIRIPQRLIEWSGLDSKIIIVGVGSYWEIWNESRWQEYCGSHKTEFDQVADALLCDSDLNHNAQLPSTKQALTESPPPNPR